MSTNNIQNLIKNFQEYIRKQEKESSTFNSENSNSVFDTDFSEEDDFTFDFLLNHSIQFKQYLRENASEETFNAVFGDGNFNENDFSRISSLSVSDSGKIETPEKSPEFQALEEAKKQQEQQEQEIEQQNQSRQLSEDTKKAAQYFNMSPEQFEEYTEKYGFSADELAAYVVDFYENYEKSQETPSQDPSKDPTNSTPDPSSDSVSQEVPPTSQTPTSEAPTESQETPSQDPTNSTPDSTNPASQTDSLASAQAQEILNDSYNNVNILASLDVNKDDEVSADEKTEFEDFINQTCTEEEITDDMMDSFYAFDAVKKLFSEDGKDLSDKEKQKLLDIIKEKYNVDKLDSKTLQTALLDILKGDFESENLEESEEPEKPEETQQSQTQSPSSSGGGGSVSAPSGASGASNSSAPQEEPSMSLEEFDELYDSDSSELASNLESMSLDKLENLRNEEMERLSEAETDIETVSNDGRENVESAQKDYDGAKETFDTAQEEYQKAVDEDEWLNNNGEPPYAQQISENLEAIATAETTKNETQNTLAQSERDVASSTVALGQANAALASATSQVAALENALNSFESSSDEGYSEAKAAYDAAVEAQKEAQQQYDKADENLNTAKTALEDAKIAYDNATADLEELEKTKAELDEIVQNNASEETKVALEKYTEAKETLDTAQSAVEEAVKAQSEALSKAQETLNAEQKKLEAIDAAYNKKKAEETERKNGANTSGKEFLSNLEEAGGDAFDMFDNLAKSLNLSREEAAEYIAKLCADENFGNGTIDPVVFCAQLCQESGLSQYSSDGSVKVGDSGLAYGLGQIHPECAQDIARMTNGAHSYTSEDRLDPYKNLEMAILVDRYWFEQTGSVAGALGSYNQGNASSGMGSAGQGYYEACMSRLAKYSA